MKTNKYILFLLFLPSVFYAQKKKHKNAFFVGTSQGISFVVKESFSNTTAKTFSTGIGYSYKIEAGYSIVSKSRKYASDFSLGYNSMGNSVDIIDVRKTALGKPQKTSYDRFNFLTFRYTFSIYVKTFKDYNTFFSVGVQFAYLLNQKTTVNFFDGKTIFRKSASEISKNILITTSPTFLLSYGVEFDKKIFNFGKGFRLSLDFSYDFYALALTSSPANQYFGTFLNYRILF